MKTLTAVRWAIIEAEERLKESMDTEEEAPMREILKSLMVVEKDLTCTSTK